MPDTSVSMFAPTGSRTLWVFQRHLKNHLLDVCDRPNSSGWTVVAHKLQSARQSAIDRRLRPVRARQRGCPDWRKRTERTKGSSVAFSVPFVVLDGQRTT